MTLQSGNSFKLHPEEPDIPTKGKVRHLTTTATCLNSLLDCPQRFAPETYSGIESLCATFAERALKRRTWISEGSAGIYCRCRALPIVIDYSDALNSSIKNHVSDVFFQLDEQPNRFGIGEADPRHEDRWYPPNAYHTYWALDILARIEKKWPKAYQTLSTDLNLALKQDGMLMWSRQELGKQIALHSATPRSSMLDTDQLGWALAVFFRFENGIHSNLEKQDFAKQCLRCLFSTQISGVGTWQHYKPLFHYKESGDAYCYVFETFTAVLQCALDSRPEAEIVRQLLRPYCRNLIDLWQYADSTKMPLESKDTFGWSSGHRTNVNSPESWATASVFSYTQALRRLIGIWCREEAFGMIKTPQTGRKKTVAENELESRGKTWDSKKSPVSERLYTLFINPVRMHDCRDRLEPDSQPIEDAHARSAILFGPPGTSKTTLIRAMADAIGWKYVEIHASHFVKEGLAQVQKTADDIFKQLSELDHTVVLFDEIDELVRERDMEKDAFGRFLTTSMLPKLAELWDARKILYFVATNHINYFDSAIIRSHRFDALILVSPPSFQVKVERLQSLLAGKHDLPGRTFRTTESEVKDSLSAFESAFEKSAGAKSSQEIETFRESKLGPEFVLSKFALLRFDEMEELAYRLAAKIGAKSPKPKIISTELLGEALKSVDDSEWRKNKNYLDFLRDIRSERRDYQMPNAWRVISQKTDGIPDLTLANDTVWLQRAVDSHREIALPGYDLKFHERGTVSIRKSIR
jgi:predicted ATPase